MEKELKKNKGITLVALVVTIIVLIILAGISINLLLGQNGILTKAKEAKKEQKLAEVKEKLSLEIASAETDAILRDENLEQKQLEDIINKYGTLQADGDTIITKDDNYELSLKEIWYGVLSESGSYSDKVTQVEMLEKQLEELQTQYEQLKSLNEGNTGTLEELRSQIENLQKEKSTLEGELSAKQKEIKNYIDSKNTWKYMGSVQSGSGYIPNSTYAELVKAGYNEVMMVGEGGIRTYSMNLPVHILNELGTRTYSTGASTYSFGVAGVMEIQYDEQNGFCLSRFFLDDELLTTATMYFYAK